MHHLLGRERVDAAQHREAVGTPEVLEGALRGEAGLHRAVDELAVVGVACGATSRDHLQARERERERLYVCACGGGMPCVCGGEGVQAPIGEDDQ